LASNEVKLLVHNRKVDLANNYEKLSQKTALMTTIILSIKPHDFAYIPNCETFKFFPTTRPNTLFFMLTGICGINQILFFPLKFYMDDSFPDWRTILQLDDYTSKTFASFAKSINVVYLSA